MGIIGIGVRGGGGGVGFLGEAAPWVIKVSFGQVRTIFRAIVGLLFMGGGGGGACRFQ